MRKVIALWIIFILLFISTPVIAARAQGETTTGKVIKAGGLLVLDVLTLGLTEVIATPVTDGKNYIVIEVNYDKDERVETFKFISQ